jgi:hypothetical protein
MEQEQLQQYLGFYQKLFKNPDYTEKVEGQRETLKNKRYTVQQ